ncbi:calcium:proton antiporter [bacterium]|nr:calcium:proton antiporter [bacterium]
MQKVRLGFAWLTVALFLGFSGSWLADPIAPATAGVLFVWLFATMAWSAFGALKVADKLAEILGEPLGSLVLTLTIIGLEGVLIAIAILTSEAGATIGRDTLLGANMIMINLAGGLALFLGGLRHSEQTYNFQGTSAYLAVVIVLCVIGFVLPNYTTATPHGSVTNTQAAGIVVVTLFIYGTFLLMQIGRHKHFFVEPNAGGNTKTEPPTAPTTAPAMPAGPAEKKGGIGQLTLLLLAGVVPVLLLGKFLTTILDHASTKLGTPPALGGVIIALIVVSPKLISAIKAGLADEPQRAANLALGSCAPAMGVILPIILLIGLATGKTIVMGVVPAEVILLALTLVMSLLTFSGPRTTLLEGAAHLAIFVVYIVLMFSP